MRDLTGLTVRSLGSGSSPPDGNSVAEVFHCAAKGSSPISSSSTLTTAHDRFLLFFFRLFLKRFGRFWRFKLFKEPHSILRAPPG